jgi:hypothetical protein
MQDFGKKQNCHKLNDFLKENIQNSKKYLKKNSKSSDF